MMPPGMGASPASLPVVPVAAAAAHYRQLQFTQSAPAHSGRANSVVLSDGTQIVIEQEDEIL